MITEIENEHIIPLYTQPRIGDVRDSLADISKAKQILGYNPLFNLKQGFEKTHQFLEKNNYYN